MLGGQLERCCPDWVRQPDGSGLCPRVELDPANETAAQICSFLLHEKLAPVAALLAQSLTAQLDPGDVAMILNRVAGTLRDQAIHERLYPPR